jgi:hypothetical protein
MACFAERSMNRLPGAVRETTDIVGAGLVPESFLRGNNYNVPKSHAPLLAALEVDRARQLFVAVKSAASNPWNLLVGNNGLTILSDGNGSSDESDIEGLPFSGLAR